MTKISEISSTPIMATSADVFTRISEKIRNYLAVAQDTSSSPAAKIAAIAAFYGKDPAFRFCDADGPFHHGWGPINGDDSQSYQRWFSAIFSGGIKSQRFSFIDLSVVQLGSTLLSTCHVTADVTDMHDVANHMELQLTFLWRKKGSNDYEICHEHFSVKGDWVWQ
jgi:ketosteroid isomerase-like protein